MDKRTRVILIVAAIAIAGYLAWRWYQNSSASSGSGGTGLGSNLNSVAPELVGGSTGPNTTSGPAVALPVNITLNETAPVNSNGAAPMLGANNRVPSALSRQSGAAANAPGILSADQAFDAGGPTGSLDTGDGMDSSLASPTPQFKGDLAVHPPPGPETGSHAPAASGAITTAPHHPRAARSVRTTNNPSKETSSRENRAHPLSQTRHRGESRSRRRPRKG